MYRARTLLFLLILVPLLGAPGVAAAHGMLERTEPRSGAAVKSPPPHVRLWFTGALEPAYSRVQVLDAEGKRMDLGDSALDAGNRALLRVSVPALGPGRYRVLWRVLSVDSHLTEGEFAFRVVP